MNVIVPLIVASAILAAPVLKSQTSSHPSESATKTTLISDLPSDPYDPGPYGGNPRGPNPRGGDPHDEYHDPNLPSNRDEEERKAQNKPAQPAP